MHSLREAVLHYYKSTPCVVSKTHTQKKQQQQQQQLEDKGALRRTKGKSMMHALYVLQLAKRHVSQALPDIVYPFVSLGGVLLYMNEGVLKSSSTFVKNFS